MTVKHTLVGASYIAAAMGQSREHWGRILAELFREDDPRIHQVGTMYVVTKADADKIIATWPSAHPRGAPTGNTNARKRKEK